MLKADNSRPGTAAGGKQGGKPAIKSPPYNITANAPAAEPANQPP
jgi:hypothetical protein